MPDYTQLEDTLAAEREVHAEDKALLDSAMFVLKALRNSLKDEKRHADGLASTMLESASILDLDEHTDEIASVIRDLFNALRAHDARRATATAARDDGEEGG